MKIILSNKQEIAISQEEAELVNRALLANANFIKIGQELFNARYILGIFESPEPSIKSTRLIEAPKESNNLEKITEILNQMKNDLKQKGII